MRRETTLKISISLALTVATLAVFWQVGNNGFIIYDDPSYVLENSHVASGLSLENLRWAFTAIHLSNWHPLTWISHMTDVRLFGMNPAGHHFTSLFFHLLSAIILFHFLSRMTGALWRSALVAALFALHPLHVESVAWVSERKDVLSALFWMLTMWAYAVYTKRPGISRYLTVVLLFILGLMAKAMLVTLPIVLLLLDYWPLGRLHGEGRGGDVAKPSAFGLWTVFLEKLPLLALAIASSAITYLAQEKWGSVTHDGSILVNLGNSLLSYLVYMRKMVWPANLAVFYPFDPAAVSAVKCAVAGILLAAISILALWHGKRRPYIPVGWFWYLATLLPVIGIIRLGQHAMADRYTYIPLIGLFIVIAWGAGDLAADVAWRRWAVIPPILAVLLSCAVLAKRQVGYWRDSITLFTRAAMVTDNNCLAYDNLSGAYVERGDLVAALKAISASLEIHPNPLAFTHQGWIYKQLGAYQESIAACLRALQLDPGHEKAHFLLAQDYIQLKRFSAAVDEYRFLLARGSAYAPELLEHLKIYGIDISRGENELNGVLQNDP